MADLISISPRTYDLEGSLLLRAGPGSNWRGGERRVSRSATLDGGVAIYDGGFSDGDRTLQITHINPTRAQVDRAEALCRTHTTVTIATPDGCYAGVLERYAYTDAALSVTLLLSSRLDTL